MTKQRRYTKNVKVTMYLAECEHAVSLTNGSGYVYCDDCQDTVAQRPVGTILVSLDKDGFLTTTTPLRVK